MLLIAPDPERKRAVFCVKTIRIALYTLHPITAAILELGIMAIGVKDELVAGRMVEINLDCHVAVDAVDRIDARAVRTRKRRAAT